MAAWLIGRLVQEAAKKVARMPSSGPSHEQAAGDRDDQACHRRHRQDQAADEEGVTERSATVWADVGSRAD
jgi:hypothetical protein